MSGHLLKTFLQKILTLATPVHDNYDISNFSPPSWAKDCGLIDLPTEGLLASADGCDLAVFDGGLHWSFSGERIVDAGNLQPGYGTDHGRVPPTYQSESIRDSLSRLFRYFAIVPQILTGSTDSHPRSLTSSWTLLDIPNVFPSYQQAYRGDAAREDV